MLDSPQSAKFLESIGLSFDDVAKNEQPTIWLQIFDFCNSQDIILIFDTSHNKYLLGNFRDLSDEDQSEVVDEFCTNAQQILEDMIQEKDVRVHKPNKRQGSP